MRASVAVRREQTWKHRRAFNLDGVKGGRIKAQELQDGRRHLTGFHKARNRPGLADAGVRYQQHYVGIIMGEAAVLGLFLERALTLAEREDISPICCYGNTSVEAPTCLSIRKRSSTRSRCA